MEDVNDIFKTNTGLVGRCRNWQVEAWELLDLVGELRDYVRWRANSCSRAVLIASEIGEDGQPTGGIDEDNAEGQRFVSIVAAIAGGPLGQADLIKRVVECLTVPGELWIAILMRPEGERWFAVSRDEIEKGARRDSVLIVLPDGKKHTYDAAAGDGIFRVWNPHPRKASEPDSPVHSCLDPLREIVRTTRKIRNADNSRLNNNGLLVFPSEASLPPHPAPVSAGKPGDPPAEQPPNVPVTAALQKRIIEVSEEGAKDENSAASLAPITLSVPGDHVDKIKHITFGKDVTDLAIKTRNDAIARLAMGLDVAPEHMLGTGSVNHWNKFQLADEDVQLHVAPVMQTICQAIYSNVLAGMLAAAGVDPGKYTLWYDTSGLTADPDLTDESETAYSGGALRTDAYLRRAGLSEEDGYDLTSLEGWQVWARDAVQRDPGRIRELLPLLASEVQALDFPEPARALPPGDDPDDDEDEESGASRGEEPDTEDQAGEHSVRLTAPSAFDLIIDQLVARALELAGGRRRTREDRSRLGHVANRDLNRYKGPVEESAVADLIRGWDSILNESRLAELGIDPDQVRASVRRLAKHELTSQVVDGQVI